MYHNSVFVTFLLLYFEKVRLLRDNHPPSLAKMKEVQICSDKTQYLTDDDYLDEKSFIPKGCSDGDIEITVKLNNFRRINYVILYSSRTVDSGDDPLDRFNAYMLDTNQTKWWCGRFPRPINMTKIFSKGFRVNCINHYKNFNKVVIVLEYQTQFQLAEIGVYSLVLPGQAFHRGCFYSEEADGYAETISNLNLANCIRTCEYGESLVMIGKNKCACGDVTWLEREVNMSECDNCLEVERCGGREAYSVYLLEFQLPYVSGCLKYYQNQIEVPNVTIKECMHRCDGDVFSWITANQCGCLNNPKLFRRPETHCHDICMENEDQMCEEDSLIITNCMEQPNYQFHCNKLFHCLNGNYDQYGICIEGCEDGWFGLYCIERDQGFQTNTTDGISISVPLSTTVNGGTHTAFDGIPTSVTSFGRIPNSVTSFSRTPKPVTSLILTPKPVTSFGRTPTTVTSIDGTPKPVTSFSRTPKPVTSFGRTPISVTSYGRTPKPVTSLGRTPTAVTSFVGTPKSVTSFSRTPKSVTSYGRTPKPVTSLGRTQTAVTSFDQTTLDSSLDVTPTPDAPFNVTLGIPDSTTDCGGTRASDNRLDITATPDYPLDVTLTSFDGTQNVPDSTIDGGGTQTSDSPLDGTQISETALDVTPTKYTPLDSTPKPDFPYDSHQVNETTERLVVEISTSNGIFIYFVFILCFAVWSLFESPY